MGPGALLCLFVVCLLLQARESVAFLGFGLYEKTCGAPLLAAWALGPSSFRPALGYPSRILNG